VLSRALRPSAPLPVPAQAVTDHRPDMMCMCMCLRIYAVSLILSGLLFSYGRHMCARLTTATLMVLYARDVRAT